MEDYTKLAQELIEDHITDAIEWDKTKTRNDVLTALQDDTENVFGNIDGSRTMSTYKAEQFINKSNAIFDDDIVNLYGDMGDNYLVETLMRGAETFDVVTLELVAPQVIAEMLGE